VSLLQIFVLAVVQGITEFLPISSSGHLILVPELTDWPDQGVKMDVAVHVGTLGAVMLYFRQDVVRLFNGLFDLVLFRKRSDGSDKFLFLSLVLATIPVVIFGAVASMTGLNDLWRTMEVIAWTSIIFGILLYVIDTRCPVTKQIADLKYGQALIMGLAQVIALIPGTSRSGITMTAARGMGFSRTEAARYSMLMSIPTILAAGTLESLKLIDSGDTTLGMDVIIGAVLAFIAALLAIAGLMKWLQRSSMTPFVIYRVLLGIGLLAFVYF